MAHTTAETTRGALCREIYSEKVVVAEERRARLEVSPSGAFGAAWLDAALSNNYRRPVIGYADDLESFGRREVAAFYQR